MKEDIKQELGGRLLTIKGMIEEHEFITEGMIRNDIHHREYNGLEETGAVIHKGRRVLIDEDKYIAWIRDGTKKSVTKEDKEHKRLMVSINRAVYG